MNGLLVLGDDVVAVGVEEDGITLDRARRRRGIHVFGWHVENTETVIPASYFLND